MQPLLWLTGAWVTSYSALLTVAPLWARDGGAGTTGVGLVNGVLLGTTIVGQVGVPAALRRFGHARVLSSGCLLLGLPALLHLLSSNLLVILALSVVRGTGLAVVTVCNATIFAEIVPQRLRAAASGLYGLGSALPTLVFVPLSVTVAEKLGFAWAFALGAVAVLGVVPAVRLDRIIRQSRTELLVVELPTGDRRRSMRRAGPHAAVLFATTAASAGIQTFLPQLVSARVASIGLLALGVFSALGRWGVGHAVDLQRGFVEPSLLAVSVVGLLMLSAGLAQPLDTLVVVAMVPLGLGYGAVLSTTLTRSFDSVDPAQYGSVSAVWNLSLDAGTAVGAITVGVVAHWADFETAFVVLAAYVGATAAATIVNGTRRPPLPG